MAKRSPAQKKQLFFVGSGRGDCGEVEEAAYLRETLDVITALCEQLNDARVRIPDTTLRLYFAVARETGLSEMASGVLSLCLESLDEVIRIRLWQNSRASLQMQNP